MLTAFGWYITLVVCLNAIVAGGGSNLLKEAVAVSLTEEEKKEVVRGSKIVIVSEQAMLNMIYTIKACMLFMYVRLTAGLRQQKWVKILAVYVGLGWLGSQLAFFFACRPFHDYYAANPADDQCTTLQHFSISQACFNISSDILMLVVMLPLLAQVNLPLKQRAALLIVFGLGSFVIVAAVLTKYFNLSNVWSPVYMLWYVREASTAVYVSNLPMIWPLLREWFPYLRKVTPGHRSTVRSRIPGAGRGILCGVGGSQHKPNKTSVIMSHLSHGKKSQESSSGTETEVEGTGSADQINKHQLGGNGILAETTVDIDIGEDHRSSSSVDVEKSAGGHEQDRMRYEWDRSPINRQIDEVPNGRSFFGHGGKPPDGAEKGYAASQADLERGASHWRAASLSHATRSDNDINGRAC